MHHCSYTTFINAIRNPHTLLRALCDAVIDIDTAEHTKHFAECHATVDKRDITIYAPISLEAMTLAESAAAIISTTRGALGTFDILREELLCNTPMPYYCPLVVEHCPVGIPLREALYTHSRSNLHRGMATLRDTLKRHNISHNHLTLDNIVVDHNHTWHATHNYYMSRGAGGDDDAFNYIATLIDDRALPDIVTVNEGYAPYSAQGYPLVGRRRRTVTARGVGFEDEEGNLIIEDKYLSATDFDENRAIVVTHERKVGIIDRDGRDIIAPIYDDIEYDTDDGTSRVRLGNRIATFDYNGEQTTEWSER